MMSGNVKVVVQIIGGLALFLYGMGLMSSGLKESAGEKLKAALGYMTKNRFFAIIAGTIVTGLIQSSSATSVMAVGFVNAGLLSLQQAIGVIFGANIGTTVTGQLVAFKLSDIALPAVTIGVIGLMISKRVETRGIWRTLLGFGLLFFGMNMMSHELKTLAKDPTFLAFFSKFDCAPNASGYLPPLSVLGAIAVGTACTMLVQSSSATIGITIALASTGVISLWTAIPIVFGDNIGTTITAALAAIGTNANAKRTALAHALFNLIGTALVVSSFLIVTKDSAGIAAPVFFHAVNAIAPGNGLLGENLGRHVAMAHTLFNVSNVVILSFFIPQLATLCEKIIPGQKIKDTTLEPRLLATPELALQAAVRALCDMTRRATTLVNVSVKSALGEASIPEEAIDDAEAEVDQQQLNIRDYLVAISQQKLTDRTARSLPELVHCVNDAERISDLALIIHSRIATRLKSLNDEDREMLRTMIRSIRLLARETLDALRGNKGAAQAAHDIEDDILERIQLAGAESALQLVGILSSVRDITRHLGNIAERSATI